MRLQKQRILNRLFLKLSPYMERTERGVKGEILSHSIHSASLMV